MLDIRALLSIADAYREIAGIEREVTLSYRIFGDSKRLASLRMGSDLTVGRFNGAMHWFVAHWPEGEDLPDALGRYLPARGDDGATTAPLAVDPPEAAA